MNIRFDANSLRDDYREEVMAWVKSLGVEPRDVRPVCLIVEGDTGYELHLSRFLRSETGNIRLDRAAEIPVTEPLVVGLGSSKSWPAWLETAAQQQLQVNVEQDRALGVSLQRILRGARIDLGGRA